MALALWPALAEPATASPAGKGLQVYFVDVEGGQSTLFVTPSGQSLLIDTGWAGNDGRDANRIVAAAKKAGVTRINYVLITHFHGDHVGGAPELAARIPIDTFIDHGENPQVNTFGFQIPKEYQQLIDSGKYKHVIAKPGDTVPIQGMQVTVVSGNAATISHSLPGAGQKNPSCDGAPQYPRDTTENRNSLGAAITFGKLRILDLGDLTTDEEMELMCPVNKLGRFDILVVSHHGSTSSSSPQLVYGIAARVAIMDNGATKGGSPSVWDTIEKSPGLEDLWQLHFAVGGGSEHNVPADFIANLGGANDPDAGNYIELIAQAGWKLCGVQFAHAEDEGLRCAMNVRQEFEI